MLLTPLIGEIPFANPFAILLLAFALDMALGDPQWLYRALPHPVALLGRLIAVLEARLNRSQRSARDRFWRGLVTTLVVTLLAAGLAAAIAWAVRLWAHGWLIEGLLASTLLAYRGLLDAVFKVAVGLEVNTATGRAAVAEIVGRDPASLDRHGVARAAAESLAENFSDGVVAPLFWFALLGLPGLAAYKAINTLDSMIGYRSTRYAAFGRAAALLDDAVNWLPARLAGLFFVAAAAVHPKAKAVRAWQVMRRDAPQHRSPNAGWQEAALAGALGFALAGPRHYPSGPVVDCWMGDGRARLSAQDLRDALLLYRIAGGLVALVLVVLWLVS